MLLALLIIMLLFGGGWFGYYGRGVGYHPGVYGSPIGLIVLVLILVFLFR